MASDPNSPFDPTLGATTWRIPGNRWFPKGTQPAASSQVRAQRTAASGVVPLHFTRADGDFVIVPDPALADCALLVAFVNLLLDLLEQGIPFSLEPGMSKKDFDALKATHKLAVPADAVFTRNIGLEIDMTNVPPGSVVDISALADRSASIKKRAAKGSKSKRALERGKLTPPKSAKKPATKPSPKRKKGSSS